MESKPRSSIFNHMLLNKLKPLYEVGAITILILHMRKLTLSEIK